MTRPRGRGGSSRRAVVLSLVSVLWLPGCSEIIRQFIPVAGDDAQAPLPDAVFAMDGDGFVLDKLTLLAANPDHGPFVGGTEVTLSGSGLRSPLQVTVGGKAVQEPEIRILSPIAVSIVTPAGKVGPADIEVTAIDRKSVV